MSIYNLSNKEEDNGNKVLEKCLKRKKTYTQTCICFKNYKAASCFIFFLFKAKEWGAYIRASTIKIKYHHNHNTRNTAKSQLSLFTTQAKTQVMRNRHYQETLIRVGQDHSCFCIAVRKLFLFCLGSLRDPMGLRAHNRSSPPSTLIPTILDVSRFDPKSVRTTPSDFND